MLLLQRHYNVFMLRKINDMKTLHDWNPDSPCRFNQYINENGTIGKVYYLESGATVKINNADFIPVFEKSQLEQKKRKK